jgi:hypothetical protein
MCALSAKTEMVCMEKEPGCDGNAALHVCFEEGGSEFVCRSCFDSRVNEGDWTTHATEILLAS